MSLDTIRQMRRAGQKPEVVYVVIGEVAKRPREGDSGYVWVRAYDHPALMDWRPLVGLLTVVVTTQPLPHLTIAVLDALHAASAKLFGAADTTGVYPLLEGADDEHAALLRRTWEALCH
jgi:hypothetical protein